MLVGEKSRFTRIDLTRRRAAAAKLHGEEAFA
jgi:hypothetical protein